MSGISEYQHRYLSHLLASAIFGSAESYDSVTQDMVQSATGVDKPLHEFSRQEASQAITKLKHDKSGALRRIQIDKIVSDMGIGRKAL